MRDILSRICFALGMKKRARMPRMQEQHLLDGVEVRLVCDDERPRYDAYLDKQHYANKAAMLMQRTDPGKDPKTDGIVFLLSSRSGLSADERLKLKRDYWDIENGAHQRLDGSRLQEDKSRVRNRHAATNLGLFRRTACPYPRLLTVNFAENCTETNCIVLFVVNGTENSSRQGLRSGYSQWFTTRFTL